MFDPVREDNVGNTLVGSVYSIASAPPAPIPHWPGPPLVSIVPRPAMRDVVIQTEPPAPECVCWAPFARIAPSTTTLSATMRTAPPPGPKALGSVEAPSSLGR